MMSLLLKPARAALDEDRTSGILTPGANVGTARPSVAIWEGDTCNDRKQDPVMETGPCHGGGGTGGWTSAWTPTPPADSLRSLGSSPVRASPTTVGDTDALLVGYAWVRSQVGFVVPAQCGAAGASQSCRRRACAPICLRETKPGTPHAACTGHHAATLCSALRTAAAALTPTPGADHTRTQLDRSTLEAL